ncbi:hydrogenase maturation nickel metallochaperone HypA/HybF [Bacillus massiliigorillae]|uniref:hydrogenase maturation nickel metallochaperone HypA/HybF n=1 Tax=Bacillus massiliigorillae TaxID=1243664 RepID=UPI00039B0835|nr:hydrogenase maturation nickel metallochaperone HypA [Bacillus massiliigorillae]
MHEMALMGDILNIIQEDAVTRQINQLEKIELTVGELSNAMPDALRMAFAIYKEQNPQLFAEDAALFIHMEEAKAECIFCNCHYKPTQRISICPSCNMPSGKLISGETFQVLSYEGSQKK